MEGETDHRERVGKGREKNREREERRLRRLMQYAVWSTFTITSSNKTTAF